MTTGTTLADLAWAHLVVGTALAGLGHIADEKRHAALAGAAALEADDTEALTVRGDRAAPAYALAGVADRETLDLLDAALEHVGAGPVGRRQPARLPAPSTSSTRRAEAKGARAAAAPDDRDGAGLRRPRGAGRTRS